MSAYGPDRLMQELAKLGYPSEKVIGNDGGTYVVLPEYEIFVGRFLGRAIDLALFGTPDFPNSVHSSIHVRAAPQLYEPNQNIAQVRNVQTSGLGPEWRYWSHNFNWPAETEKTVRRLMTKITKIFDNA